MKKASELMEQRPFLDVFAYGPSGSGKTLWGCRSPMPLILLTETHATNKIGRVAPDAIVHHIHRYEDFIEVMKALMAGRSVVLDIWGGKQPAFAFDWHGQQVVCQTIVIDSMTDLQSHLETWVASNPTEITIQEWGRITQNTKALMRDLRSLPVNMVVLALEDETVDDRKVRRIAPAIRGKVGKMIGQWFSAVGYTTKVSVEKGVDYVICWELPSTYTTKRELGFPSKMQVKLKEGCGTLGSLMLSIMEGGVAVPAGADDRADLVEEYGASETGDKQEDGGDS